MIPFQMKPEQIFQEIGAISNKLMRGVDNLSQIGKLEEGISPRYAVYREDKMVLYHYQPRTMPQKRTPVLIVYALVNRPYMADLQDGRSMIQGLLDAGLDVYLIDWGYPDIVDSYLTLENYIAGYIDHCADYILNQHGLDKINLLGICQGGTFSLCYTALFQHKIRNLITTVSPVDFHTEKDLLSKMVRYVDIDLLIDSQGNVAGDRLNAIYLSLKPYQLMGQKYLGLVDILDDAEKVRNFMQMEKWIFDSPDQAGEAFRQFISQFYQQNKLIQGEVRIGERLVDLKKIVCPILNIYASADHLVPPESSKALDGCTNSEDYSELEFPGGHIGIYVSKRAHNMIPPSVGNWLENREIK